MLTGLKQSFFTAKLLKGKLKKIKTEFWINPGDHVL